MSGRRIYEFKKKLFSPDKMEQSVRYNAHYNWEWVVSHAASAISSASLQSKTRDLPSRKKALQKALADYAAMQQSDLVVHQQFDAHPGSTPPSLSPLPPAPTIKTVSDGAYSLFRCEIVDSNNDLVSAIWASNKDLEFLDAKDTLFRCCSKYGAADLMPSTILIPWNIDTEEALADLLTGEAAIEKNFEGYFDNNSYFLKAALGSGGFGIYSNISRPNDILELMRGHRRRAETYDGFIDNLINTYGDVPAWSLQRRVAPVTAIVHGAIRNTQIRSYCILLDGNMYLYDSFEVRVPIWEEEVETSTSSANVSGGGEEGEVDSEVKKSEVMSEIEREYIGSGAARPYNYGRNKKETERFLLQELPELSGSYDAIQDTSLRLLQSFEDAIFERKTPEKKVYPDMSANAFCSSFGINSQINVLSEMAILGIDLVVEKSTEGQFRAYVVEVNNNPAIAPEDKKMSALYKTHLLDFVEHVIKLGLGSKSGKYKKSSDHFLKVW